jgi:uncharacterized protein with ACT and thioredoxin-like domain
VTHHQFGAIVGDADIGGTFELAGSVLYREHVTLAVDSISDGQHVPVIALQLSGRINKTGDTVQTVYVLPVMDAGQLAGALWAAARRIGHQEVSDFQVGLELGAAS